VATTKKPQAKAPNPVEHSIEMKALYERLDNQELQISMLIRCVSELQKMYKREVAESRKIVESIL
jgi:hypothetical protein